MPAVEIIDFHESKFWKPEKEFTKKLESIGTKEINGVKELCLNFGVEANADGEEIPCDLVIRGINKLKEDGHVSDYFDMGKFIKSTRALGLKPMLEENGTVSFTPSPVGKMVTMSPENPKGREVTSADGTKNVYYSWIMTAVQGLGKAPEPRKTAAQQPSDKPKSEDTIEPFYDWMVSNAATPMTESQITRKLMDEHKANPTGMNLNTNRRVNLLALVKDGRVTQDITDPKNPKYSVA